MPPFGWIIGSEKKNKKMECNPPLSPPAKRTHVEESQSSSATVMWEIELWREGREVPGASTRGALLYKTLPCSETLTASSAPSGMPCFHSCDMK